MGTPTLHRSKQEMKLSSESMNWFMEVFVAG